MFFMRRPLAAQTRPLPTPPLSCRTHSPTPRLRTAARQVRRGRATATIITALVLSPAAAWAGPLTGPILNEGLAAAVEDGLELPVTSRGSRPRARLNVLREAPDASGRLFVNDLNGPLYRIAGGTVHVYMNLADIFRDLKTSPGLGSGFVSFAFHPDFSTNGRFYTVHTENVTRRSPPPNLGPAIATNIVHHVVLNEWRLANAAANACSPLADAPNCTRRELIRIAASHRFHNLGEIAFNPTARPSDDDYGLLYIGGGDYGTAEFDDPGQLQRLDTPYGTLLRIDPLGGPFVRNGVVYGYGIPPGNPFASDEDPNTLGEIYAYGFRNAHRISWDSNGVCYVSDIGQGNGEEINRLVAGANYGWPAREGIWGIDAELDLEEPVLPLPPDPEPYRYPVAAYDHAEGQAIAGGFVAQKPGSALDGKFIFGDIANGRIFYADAGDLVAADDAQPGTLAPIFELNLTYQGAPTTLLELVRNALGNPNVDRTDLRLGQDAERNLYLTTKQDGFVRTLVLPDGAPAPCAGTLCSPTLLP